MIAFILESTICLFFSYGFYHLVLRHLKTFSFNRYYLLFSILFSLVIPFIEIRVGFNTPVGQGLNGLGFTTGELIQGEAISGTPVRVFSVELMVKFLYGVVTAIFFVRFLVNIVKILWKIRASVPAMDLKARICLVEEQTLPYSFFNRIVVNRIEFENDLIDTELLFHEQAHCSQNHSVDIIAIELLKTVLWFNPFVWLFKNVIQINHEYMADHTVVTTNNRDRYQHILVNLALRNSSTYLASDFNYSLTKKRLMMMTIKNARDHAAIKRIAAIPLFLILAAVLTFCEKDKTDVVNPDDNVVYIANDWWKPILLKHDITPRAYNNFEYIFEMGSTNSISNGIVTLKDAFFLIKNGGDDYTIIRSPLAYHDLETNTISGAECTVEVYDPDKGGLEPIGIMDMYIFKYHISKGGDSYEANDSIVFHLNSRRIH